MHQFMYDVHWYQNGINRGELASPKEEDHTYQSDEICVHLKCVADWPIEVVMADYLGSRETFTESPSVGHN